jgi:hypothetical protein
VLNTAIVLATLMLGVVIVTEAALRSWRRRAAAKPAGG